MQSKTSTALLIALLTFAGSAAAQLDIPLVNGSFEDDAIPLAQDGVLLFGTTGWTQAGGAGHLRPTVVAGPAPRGTNVGALNPDATLTQTVNVAIEPGRSYVLSFLAGSLLVSTTRVEVNFRVDGQLAATWTSDLIGGQPDSRFVRQRATYTHPFASLPGAALEIVVRGASTVTSHVDDFRLTENSPYTAPADDFFSGLENHAPGAFLSGTPNIETWDNGLGSAQIVVPDGSNVTGPQLGFPTEGGQWLEIASDGSGPGAPSGAIRAQITVYAETTQVAFDWTFATEETPGATDFFDRADFGVFEDLGGSVGALLGGGTLIETSDGTQDWVPTSAASGIDGASFDEALSAPRTQRITIPDSFLGKRVLIFFDCENQVDSNVRSSLYIDNVRFEVPVERAGSEDGIVLGTTTDVSPSILTGPQALGALSGGPGQTVKVANGGDLLRVGWWSADDSAFDLLPVILVGELTTTGTYPAGFPMFNYHLSLDTAFILAGSATPGLFPSAILDPAGTLVAYPMPTGPVFTNLIGSSLLLQLVVPTQIADNGFVATTDMHEIVFQ